MHISSDFKRIFATCTKETLFLGANREMTSPSEGKPLAIPARLKDPRARARPLRAPFGRLLGAFLRSLPMNGQVQRSGWSLEREGKRGLVKKGV